MGNLKTLNETLSVKGFFTVAGLPGYLFLFDNILKVIVARKRDIENYSAVDTSAVLQIVFVSIVFGLSFHFFLIRKGTLFFKKPLSYLLAFIFACFLSILWAPNISVTGYRAFESLTYFILIVWVLFNLSIRLTPQQIIEWTAYWIVWNILLDYVSILKITSLNGYHLFFQSARTVFPMGIFFILLISKRKFFKILMVLFILFSLSNKVYFGLAFGLLGFLWGESKYKSYILILALSLVFLLLYLDIEDLLRNTLFFGRNSIDLTDSSGRNQIWNIAWHGVKENPTIGYGFVSGENSILYQSFTRAINVHNSFLSSLLAVGVVGTIPLLFYFISIVKISFSKVFPKKKWRTAIISTALMSITISMAAPGLGGRVYGSWIPVVFVFTLIVFLKQKFILVNKE